MSSPTPPLASAAPMWLRASQLPGRYPVFGATAWRAFIRSGQLPSRKIGAARIVNAADVEAFLAGSSSAECA
jgi:hypothetical protein